MGDHHHVISDGWKYIWWVKTNEEQLFNLKNDPAETRDLSGTTDQLAIMRNLMAEHMQTRTHADYDRTRLRPLENQAPSHFWGGTRA